MDPCGRLAGVGEFRGLTGRAPDPGVGSVWGTVLTSPRCTPHIASAVFTTGCSNPVSASASSTVGLG